MPVLRAHDYPAVQPVFQPNLRALRGILAALLATAFFCFCVCIALMPGIHPVPKTAKPMSRCACDRCMREVSNGQSTVNRH